MDVDDRAETIVEVEAARARADQVAAFYEQLLLSPNVTRPVAREFTVLEYWSQPAWDDD